MKSKQIKVLILDNSKSITGALKSILGISKYLYVLKEIEISLATCLGENNTPLKGFKNTYNFQFIEIARSFKTILYLPALIYNTIKLLGIINRNKIDILHINDLYNMVGITVKVFNPKVKLVYHVRLLPNSYANKLYPYWSKLIEKYADQLICVSEVVAKNFGPKATVIYDAVPFPEEIRTKTHSGNEINFLYLANYTKGKGQEYAIKAFQRISQDLPNAKLQFYGGSFNLRKNKRFKQELIDLAARLNLQNKVFFNDFIQNPEEEILKSDIMLNFSESESFSMTTLESLNYGTPVIVTDCGGPAEIIEDGVSGILVPVKDVNAMASQMTRLAKDPELRNKMSKNGIERAISKFDLATQSKKLADVYSGLIKPATSPQKHESPKSAS